MWEDVPETFWAWMAGFVDGEGSVVLGLCIKKTKSHRWNIHVNNALSIAQHRRGRLMLDEIASTTGVGAVRGKKTTDTEHMAGSDMCQYVCNSRGDLKELLKRLLPHLRLKKPQAELMLYAISLLETAMARKVTFSAGERRLTKAEAIELAAMSYGMNERGSRNTSGATFLEMKAKIEEVFAQVPNVVSERTVTLSCKSCKKDVVREKRLIRGDVFCNNKCRGEWLHTEAEASKYVKAVCAQCKVEFQRRKATVKEVMYCSVKCYGAWAREHLSKKG